MKAKPLVRFSPCTWRFAVGLVATVLLVALAACGGEDEETPAGTGTPATGSPSATVVGTATPGGTTISATPAPGISDTEILLGAEVILSGTMGAVYATIPKATNPYFNYITDTK